MKTPPSINVLHLTDGNRGGSQRHIIDLCRSDTPGTRHFVLRVATESISMHDGARDRVLVIDPAAAPDGMAAILRTVMTELAIGCVHAHALPVLLQAFESSANPLAAIPLLVTLHDLGCIDPRLFTHPATQPHADPHWLARCAPVLRAARAVIVPSVYLARQVTTHYPDLRPEVIPNGIATMPDVTLPLLPPWPASSRVFAVVGAVGPHKGAETLLRAAGALQDPQVVGVVIGYTEAQRTPGWIVPGRLYVHGRFVPDELPGLLRAYRVRLAYFPNVIPESFSYALSEVWQAGVPALVPAIGALGDRVQRAGAGWLLDDPLDADAAAAAIERLLGPAGVSPLAAARKILREPECCVPGVIAMREAVAQVYRAQTVATIDTGSDGWVRLRTLLRPSLLSSADDCALDAEWPALVREGQTLRDWNGKLSGDVASLDAAMRREQEEYLAAARKLEDDVQRLKARNEKIEADSATLAERNLVRERELALQQSLTRQIENNAEALRQRNLDIERNVIALKERNTQVEADAAALRLRNAHVEADIVALGRRNLQLDGDIVTLTRRCIELDSDVVALKERNTLVEADGFALKQRNAHVERDAAALQADLAAAQARSAGIETELVSEHERAARFERALARLPGFIRNRLLQDGR